MSGTRLDAEKVIRDAVDRALILLDVVAHNPQGEAMHKIITGSVLHALDEHGYVIRLGRCDPDTPPGFTDHLRSR